MKTKKHLKRDSVITSLPQSLWRFYMDYAIKGYGFLLLCWMIAVLVRCHLAKFSTLGCRAI